MTTAGGEPAIPTGTLMQGKKGLVMGVANDKSIAWGIASQIYDRPGRGPWPSPNMGEALERRVRAPGPREHRGPSC